MRHQWLAGLLVVLCPAIGTADSLIGTWSLPYNFRTANSPMTVVVFNIIRSNASSGIPSFHQMSMPTDVGTTILATHANITSFDTTARRLTDGADDTLGWWSADTGAVGFGVSASEWRSFFSDATGSIDFPGQNMSEIDLHLDASAITVAYPIPGSSR